ncbi:hypothetical protein [Shewanella fidelis]|uniref:hypothetical protein n=1 Tax=Shewanella fidelis TaxID=173509 RepID=UPI0004B59671|nr:hypothetical protein [Shewanella fidelis]
MDKPDLSWGSTGKLSMGHIGNCKLNEQIDKAGYIKLIKALGRGKKGSRSLTVNESFQLLHGFKLGVASEAQLSTALMLMRVRGESAEEVTGVTLALKQSVDPQWLSLNTTIDWPCYAGKRDQLPYMLFCAKALAKQGERILIHGDNRILRHRHHVGDVIKALGIVEVNSAAEAKSILDRDGVCYVNADKLSVFADIFKDLHQQLGLRSLYQTAIRCVNPTNAQLGIRSYFHRGLASQHIKIAQLLAQYEPESRVLIFKGYQGEAEINPRCSTKLYIFPWENDHCQSVDVSGVDQVLIINQPAGLDMLQGDKLLDKHLSANWLTILKGCNTLYLPTKVVNSDLEKESVIDKNERMRVKAIIESTLTALNLLIKPSLSLSDARTQAEYITKQSLPHLIRDISNPELINCPDQLNRLEKINNTDNKSRFVSKEYKRLSSDNKQEEPADAHY